MRFISLSSLRTMTDQFGDLTTIEGRNTIAIALKQETFKSDEQICTKEELVAAIDQLNEQTVVFYQWIEQDQALKSLLEGKVPTLEFTDRLRWTGHFLFADFSTFISSFLTTSALKFKLHENVSELRNVFSFLVLLPKDDRQLVEQALFQQTKAQIDGQLKKLPQYTTETELLACVDAICTKDIVAIVGHFSRASYHTKVWYIDQLLSLFNHPACTARLAYRVILQLNLLELNPEHQEKIREIEKELKNGQLLNKSDKTPFLKKIRTKQILSIGAFFLLIGAAYFILKYNPSKEQHTDLGLASSFETFTKDERIQIDSLLKAKRSDATPEENETDQFLWSQTGGPSLALRSALKNKLMEQLYTDWLKCADLHNQGLIDSCIPYKKSTNFKYPSVKPAKEMLGKDEVVVRNESIYSVWIIVFEEFTQGSIYAELLEAGKTSTLKMSKNQHFVFAAGKEPGVFIAPKGVNSAELPSEQFQEQFCTVDMNLSNSLNAVYALRSPKPGSNKLLLSGDENNYFVVADLYGILETF